MIGGINVADIRDRIVAPVIRVLGLWPDPVRAQDMTMMLLRIGAQESGEGGRLVQAGGGPALGPWQVEPRTHDDVWKNYLAYREDLVGRVSLLRLSPAVMSSVDQLAANLLYSCAIAALVVERAPGQTPAAADLDAQAAYYVAYYNAGGKATLDQFKTNARAFGLG